MVLSEEENAEIEKALNTLSTYSRYEELSDEHKQTLEEILYPVVLNPIVNSMNKLSTMLDSFGDIEWSLFEKLQSRANDVRQKYIRRLLEDDGGAGGGGDVGCGDVAGGDVATGVTDGVATVPGAGLGVPLGADLVGVPLGADLVGVPLGADLVGVPLGGVAMVSGVVSGGAEARGAGNRFSVRIRDNPRPNYHAVSPVRYKRKNRNQTTPLTIPGPLIPGPLTPSVTVNSELGGSPLPPRVTSERGDPGGNSSSNFTTSSNVTTRSVQGLAGNEEERTLINSWIIERNLDFSMNLSVEDIKDLNGRILAFGGVETAGLLKLKESIAFLVEEQLLLDTVQREVATLKTNLEGAVEAVRTSEQKLQDLAAAWLLKETEHQRKMSNFVEELDIASANIENIEKDLRTPQLNAEVKSVEIEKRKRYLAKIASKMANLRRPDSDDEANS